MTFKRTDQAREIEELNGHIAALEEENARLRGLETAIRRNTTMFQALMAHSSEGITLLAPDGTVVRVVRSLLGYGPVQLSGAFMESLVHPDDRPIFADCLRKLRNQSDQSVEFEGRFLLPDGRVAWLEMKLTDLVDDPNVHAIVCNYRDITSLKERELVVAEFQAIAERASHAIFSKDLDGNIVTWNAGAQKVYGYSPEEILGEHIWMLVPPELREEEMCNRKLVIETGLPVQFRTIRISKDASRLPVFVELTPVLDRYGRPRGMSHSSSRLCPSCR